MNGLTKQRVSAFEADQKAHGTEVALYNVLWQKAADDLQAIGVKTIKTQTTARRVGPAYKRRRP